MAGGDPARVSSRPGAPPRDGRRRRLLAAATVAAAALVAVGGAAAAVTLHGQHRQASLTGVQAAAVAPSFKAVANVTPPVAASTCTASTAFSYTGTVSATTAGTVRYQWVYSSGKPGPVRSVSFRAAGSVAVAGATVKRKTAGGGWGEIKVISPVARTSDQASYKLLCGSTGGVSVTASVTPAAMTASCDRAVPAFTATGSVKSAKAETVTYYWARSDGKDSAPATLTFTAAGTKPVRPLAVTPTAASGSGEAVLVVTSPITTASAPAAYTLTCKAPQAPPTGGAAGGQGGPTGPAGPSASTGSPSDGAGPPARNTATPGTGSSPAPKPTATQTSTTGGTATVPVSTMVWVSPVSGMVGNRNVPAHQGLTVEGGRPGWTWTVSGLPPGLSASADGGWCGITGTPTTAGTWAVTVTVRDSGNPQQTLTTSFPYTINPEMWTIVTPDFPDPVVGAPYSLQMSLNYADLSVTWASDDLPAGLSINPATGLISGTPTQKGPFNVSVTATVASQTAVPGSSSKTAVYNSTVDSAPAG
jgi:putative Ig domain-containing protein